MSKRTTFAAFVLLLVVGLLVGACAPAPTAVPPTAVPPTAVPPTAVPAARPGLVIWIHEGPEGDAMVAAAAEYNKRFNGNVVIQEMGRTAFSDKRNAAMTAGASEPDLFYFMGMSVPSFAAAGFVEPFDEYLKAYPDYDWETDVFEICQSESMFDGKIYLLPTDVTAEVLVYNKDFIPVPPKTWEEYLEMAKKFTKSINPDSPTAFGTGFSGRTPIANESWGIHLYSYGGDFLDKDGKVIVDNDVAIKSFQWWVDQIYKWKITAPDVISWDYPELLTGLQELQIPMCSQFQAAMPVLDDCAQSPKVCGKIWLAPPPAGPEGSFASTQVLGVALNPNSKNKVEAVNFAVWITSAEGGVVWTKAGGTSPRISVFKNPEIAASRGAWWDDYRIALTSGHGTIRDPHATELLKVMNDEIGKAYAQQKTPEEALRAAGKAMREILGQ